MLYLMLSRLYCACRLGGIWGFLGVFGQKMIKVCLLINLFLFSFLCYFVKFFYCTFLPFFCVDKRTKNSFASGKRAKIVSAAVG